MELEVLRLNEDLPPCAEPLREAEIVLRRGYANSRAVLRVWWVGKKREGKEKRF